MQDVERVLQTLARPGGASCRESAVLARLLYATGMRLAEAVRLRIQDIDFDRQVITLRDSTGMAHRELPLPPALHGLLGTQCAAVQWRWRAERPQVEPAPTHLWQPQPHHPAAPWATQWLFPSPVVSRDPRRGGPRRQHLHEARFVRDLASAMARCGLSQRASAHTLREAHAAHAAPPGMGQPPAEPTTAPPDEVSAPAPRHVRAYRRRSVHDALPPTDDDDDTLARQLGWTGLPRSGGVEEPAAPWRVARVGSGRPQAPPARAALRMRA
ncbi:tyrosine-type recombinase/integrase [Ideonella sp. BN130291]|uniref:tyrosine-type recombinase/integrase n=1 Tax=Ideonella sp. BN130291 TaxID=3112940 RepID=UPI002E258BDB|nr:tyrosine-type recombinase/integrase [Ideonella sp. BN130291]